MAGLGTRFTKYGFSTNKYLLPINIEKIKMIEKAILTLNITPLSILDDQIYVTPYTTFIFILREEVVKDIELRKYLKELCKSNGYGCTILSTPILTEGPASTAYIAKHYIDNDIPLIISNSDQILDWNYDKFINKCKKFDGCVLTYMPNYELIMGNADKHSFVKFDEDGKTPIEFVEKTVISKEALVGVHYYKKGSYFIKSAEYIFKNNIRAPNGEFYLSYTYQGLLDMGYNVGTHCLSDNEKFYPVGEPDDYFSYYNKSGLFYSTPLSLSSNVLDNANIGITMNKYKNGDTVKLSNKLFIVFSNDDIIKDVEVYITGDNMEYTLEKNSYSIEIEKKGEYKKINTNDYTRGWLIGNFEPSIIKTTEYELGILRHKKDEKWAFHYHVETKEINILLKGKMIINNVLINEKTVFIFEKNMISCPLFLEDCVVLCIKLPSLPGDKVII